MEKKAFRKILVANRGEIALRVMRTCRAMGIATVTVYSDADGDAPHTRFADESVHIGASPSKESYLNIEKIIEAARRSGADAIHPGYGFLSENADFPEACAAAGLVFIGPSPGSIHQMGLKTAARKLAAEIGVPITPGYDGEDQSLKTLRPEIIRIGFPVLIKASAGGGGKGMRVVRSEKEIDEAVESARREAEKAFGDGSLLLEKFIERARHVEIQILGDAHGKLVHLFERDCSLQRRHQKIIEECPSPGVDGELRRAMGEAALKIGRAINYTNAGTVEFILAPSGEFYFIEVNTRLQVEHPVTEMVTGLDLVKLQIEIAEGKPLPFSQDDLRLSGHAIEARIYAEDPNKDFLPSTGAILDWKLPGEIEGVRIDAGVECGRDVGVHYDPMLAKFIAHGADRDTALRKLSYALRASSIQGLRTNQQFLIRLLEHEKFGKGESHTGFIAERFDELMVNDDPRPDRESLAAVTLYLQMKWLNSDDFLSELPGNYRNNPFRDPSVKLRLDAEEVEVSWRQTAKNSYEIGIFDSSLKAQVLSCEPENFRLSFDGVQRSFRIVEAADMFYVHSTLGSRAVRVLPRHPLRQSAPEEGSANSPMPGQVLKILVEVGQAISAGDPLIVLEAMKMEHTMRASVDGVIEAILVNQGEVVGPGQVLVRIAASEK
jgi:acetyl-CoA carboxylase biotin carboxylase subunit